MEKILDQILSELNEIKEAQLAFQKQQEMLKNDCDSLKMDVTHLKDGQQEKNTLIKHTLTLQIENMLEIRNSLRSIESLPDQSGVPNKR
ncbi:hypothetical protein M3936_03135 [Sutcliffiella horikoshii]|uniref:hypothetical protein n=1 Tax=Sutcliffiella horikoshii TaxID=79883 RepID=UPI0007D0B6E4|nr:hypothetical protein [Sutcliffiella horikoshii]MCM3616569.1 hypothetical protein [Sutcliffiella horikoshii]